MHTRSPFFTPLFFNAFANLLTNACNCEYVIFIAFSLGLFGSHMIAVLLPEFSKCLSRQFSVIFSFAPLNHFTSGLLKFHSRTESHFLCQLKFAAFSSQNNSGFFTES